MSLPTALKPIWIASSFFVLELDVDLVEVVDGRIALESFHLVGFALAANDLESTLVRCLEFRV